MKKLARSSQRGTIRYESTNYQRSLFPTKEELDQQEDTERSSGGTLEPVLEESA